VNLDLFTDTEVATAAKKLRKNRARGPDDVPAEYWQAVAESPGGLAWLTTLCNRCWTQEEVPEDWHHALVSAIHKKGPVEDAENYRPISLVCVAYKLFASLLLKRLQVAGAEDRLTASQFGFRRGRGTTDAIFAARRHLDLALAQRNGCTAMVALDWQKAFDAVNVQALIVGLRRFGVPRKILAILEHIYADRFFVVSDGAGTSSSSTRRQRSGISQGCPLSPFLFIMLMTVLMRDATDMLCPTSRELFEKGSLSILLYADDTLLIGSSGPCLQELLDSIAAAGKNYGMELHWKKFQFIQVNGTITLNAPDGTVIQQSDLMTYLGTTLYADGGVKSELNRKLGAAWAEFCKLKRLWNRAALPKSRRIQIYNAVVVSRLLYGLSTAWLNVAELRRLNGFQARCLRAIVGVKPAFISRVSNAQVLSLAGETCLGRQLLKQQLLLFGKVARTSSEDLLRSLTFVGNTNQPATNMYIRRVGRPRNEWATMLNKESYKMSLQADRIVKNEVEWRRAVCHYCK